MLTKKFIKRSFTLKFYVKVWLCNNPFSRNVYDAVFLLLFLATLDSVKRLTISKSIVIGILSHLESM